MFPHNSSSHEISTETNAFVQNSMGDVVVLGKSSLVGVGEGRGSEHARYCDIESINSKMMAEPISHPENTAANDFSTVLPSHSGESVSTSRVPACQSVALSTTKHPTTNHPLIYYNNNKKETPNLKNTERQLMASDKDTDRFDQSVMLATIITAQQPASIKANPANIKILIIIIKTERKTGRYYGSANTSKSTSKTLSDNKTSFRVNVRVLSVGVRSTGDKFVAVVGVPSLVRMPKSDRPNRARFSLDSLDNYSLRLQLQLQLQLQFTSDNNNVKSNNSSLLRSSSRKNDENYKSVILLSSTSLDRDYDYGRFHGGQQIRCAADSSTTLIVPGTNEVESHRAPIRAQSSSPPLTELTQRACVPLELGPVAISIKGKIPCHADPSSFVDVIYGTGYCVFAGGMGTDGISVATITVGALSFQDNVNRKSNEPLGASYSVRACPQSGPERVKSLSKSMIGFRVRFRGAVFALYIPTTTTCKPTMTLTRQSASRAIVPGPSSIVRVENHPTLRQTIKSTRKNDLLSGSEQNRDGHRYFIRQYLIEKAKNLISMFKTESSYPEKNQLRRVLGLLFGPNHDHDQDQVSLDYKRRWGISCVLKLAGGGESSLNSSGAANWGSTQASAANNNNANQSGWGGTPGNPPGNSGAGNWSGNSVNRAVANPNQNPNQNQGPPGAQSVPGNVNKVNNPSQQSGQQSGPPTSQSSNPNQGNQNNNQWPQGKSSNAGPQNPSVQNNNVNPVQQQQQQSGSSGNNNQNPNQNQSVGGTTPASNNPSTKQQLEQLNTMREALFSQDGWGCQHVNQDTNWDVAPSPEPSLPKDGVPMWKPPVNNGTDLWEANLRNGGQPPPPQQPKTPWGHTPSTNIGGTWGEDDETADSSNMWTGAPAQQQNTGQWTGNQAGSNWGDPRLDHRDPRDLRSVDPREMRDPRDHRMSLDPREHMRVMDQMRDPRMEMRGDPRGISGRLNGANADAMWGQPGPPHHQMSHQHQGPPAKMLNPSNINQWAAPPPKEIMPGKPSGWEEPSPPTQRRNVPNFDDGTSLWANPAANQRAVPGSKVSHWKDLPTPNLGRGGMQCPPGMPQNRMPSQPGMKPEGGPMWGHPGAPGGRNGSWEGPHEGWDEPKTGTWNEAQLNPAWPGPHKPKPMGPAWDADMDSAPTWPHPAKPTLTKEVIWNSREFRYLCDLGFKKEDVELALRNREMNREEALELLSQLRPLDQWRRHDAHSSYDPATQSTAAPAYPRFNHVAQPMSFPPGAGVPSGSTASGVGGSVASASLLKLQQQQQQQAAVPLQQQQPSSNAPQPPFNQVSRAPQNQPSTQQLRMLVQQIQLAVQEGYLNHQILNQPLAPQTLILLNQLLQQIKVLQQLHQQHSVQSTMKGNSQSVLHISVQITKTKQQIANLQNQIAVQQATYMKQQQQQQQQQQQHQAAPPSQSSEYYKSSVHDMSALPNSFSELTMNKEPPVSQQQSRLNQWKLPSLDKDGELVNEFSRAPGTTSKPTPAAISQSHSSPNVNPLLGQGDGTWSSRLGESWPEETDGKDWQPAGAAFTDLVPEFEPGKPWKGTQMKSIEDDPSITPGSVVRSPLSLATIKDPDAIFSSSSKTSPPPPQPTNPDTSIPSLSNSTWTFNPPATTPSAFTSSKNTWGESAPPPTAVTSELWGAPMSKVRGPPPGLGSKNSNGWAGLGTVGRSWGLQGANTGWVSTWLLLKNLTPQIDGSTLKTLCMQHGPVQDFRLYLNHGIALTKYSSRDEAIKAQGALNNCVLGNTTIFAESPADSEVHTLLQQLSHGGQQQAGSSSGGGWGLRPSNKGPPPDTWGGSSSQLWGAPPSSNSLWSNAGIDSSEQQRATPSSLNSYLPGDLLGGESM